MKLQWRSREERKRKKMLKWQEYVRERGGGSLRNPEQARRECQDSERWKLFCHGHPLVGAPGSRRQNEMNRWQDGISNEEVVRRSGLEGLEELLQCYKGNVCHLKRSGKGGRE